MKRIVSLNPVPALVSDTLPYDKDAFMPGNGRSAVFVEGTRVIDPLTIATSIALLPDRRVHVMLSDTPSNSGGRHIYAVHAIGEIVGVSKPYYYSGSKYYCTVYLANLITLGVPNGPSFCNPLQTGMTKINVAPRGFDKVIDGVSVFYPALTPGWGNTTYTIGIELLDLSADDATEARIAYSVGMSTEPTATFDFLATPVGEISAAASSEASDILHAEFQLTSASGTYRALAGYDFAVALDDELEVWWLSWRCQDGILSPYLYHSDAASDVSRCRLVATPAATIAPGA